MDGFSHLKELAGYQVKIAISWICGYLIFNFYVPLIYTLVGPVEAGRFGMSWNIMSMVISTGAGLIGLQLPIVGRHIGSSNHADARGEMRKGVFMGLLFCLLFGLIVTAGSILLHPAGSRFGINFLVRISERLISPFAFLFLTIGGLAYIYTNGVISHIRAYKIEPFMPFSVIMLVLTMGSVLAGAHFGLVYICAAYCLIQWGMLPYARSIAARNRIPGLEML